MPTNAEIHADIDLYITAQRSHILNATVAQVFHDMVDNIGAGGGSQNIAEVLADGNDAGGTLIKNIGTPVDPGDAATKAYADSVGGGPTPDIADILAAGNDGGTALIKNIGDPVDPQDAATKQYVDDNAGGGGGITDITYANLLTAISGSTLSAGATYKITDRGDMGIYLQAISTNELSRTGIRKMLCPSFYGVGANGGNTWIGVWNATKNPNIGDLAIWGGLVWESLTGNIGTATTDILLDVVNWDVIPKSSFSNAEYTEMQFGVSFDIVNDWVELQWDGYGNVLGIPFVFVGGGANYCDVSDWNLMTAEVAFSDNKCWMVSNNSNAANIISNSLPGSIIRNNSNAGNISGNSQNGSIEGNSNNGHIQTNNNYGGISNNSNDGTISNNNNKGPVSGNTNTGAIYDNSNFGSIADNSNAGTINDNSNRDFILNNSNLGEIKWNANNGAIQNNSSGASSCHIRFNTNNGKIEGTWVADVTDTVVDKT